MIEGEPIRGHSDIYAIEGGIYIMHPDNNVVVLDRIIELAVQPFSFMGLAMWELDVGMWRNGVLEHIPLVTEWANDKDEANQIMLREIGIMIEQGYDNVSIIIECDNVDYIIQMLDGA